MSNESLNDMLDSQTMVLAKHTAKFEAMLIESGASSEIAFYAGITTLLATIKHSVNDLFNHPDAKKYINKAEVLSEVLHMMQLTLFAIYEDESERQMQKGKDTVQ